MVHTAEQQALSLTRNALRHVSRNFALIIPQLQEPDGIPSERG